MSVLVHKEVDGAMHQYTRDELCRMYPNASIPKDLDGVDLSSLGAAVVCTAGTSHVKVATDYTAVPMWKFLYALREAGLRVQFESYMQALEGHARDFWKTSATVSKTSPYCRHFAEFFGQRPHEITDLFNVAGNLED